MTPGPRFGNNILDSVSQKLSRSLQKADGRAIPRPIQHFGRIVLNVFAVAELTGPPSVRKLARRVRRYNFKCYPNAIEHNLFKACLQRPIGALCVSLNGICRNESGDSFLTRDIWWPIANVSHVWPPPTAIIAGSPRNAIIPSGCRARFNK